jgi:hypothetical protein
MKIHNVGLFGQVIPLGEPVLGDEVRAIAHEAGFTDEDLEMIAALGNTDLYSAEAMERRWQEQPHAKLTVVA